MKRFVKAGVAVALLALLLVLAGCPSATPTPFDGTWWLGGIQNSTGYRFASDLTVDGILGILTINSGTFTYDSTTLTINWDTAVTDTYTYSFNAAGDELTLDGLLWVRE